MKKIILVLMLAAGCYAGFTNYDLPNYSAYQRYQSTIPNSGKIPVTYTYSGAASNITFRVIDSAGTVIINDTVVRSSASAGTYTDTILTDKTTALNTYWRIVIRSATAGDSVQGTNQWIVGIGVAMAGQSYATAYNAGSAVPAGYLRHRAHMRYGIGGASVSWQMLQMDFQQAAQRDSFTSFIPYMADKIADSMNIPVFICGYVQGGTQLYGASAAYWGFKSTDTAASLYARFVARTKPHKPEIIVWDQGETDASLNISYTNYKSRQDSLFKWWRDTLGYTAKIFVVDIHPKWGGASDTINSDIRAAKRNVDDSTNTFYCGPIYDIPLLASGTAAIHPNFRGQRTMGRRVGLTVSNALRSLAYRGPRINSIAANSRGKLTCAVAFGRGASLVGSSPLGFNVINTVRDISVLSISGACTLSVSEALFTKTTSMRYMYGSNIDTAWAIFDNDSMPLENPNTFMSVTVGTVADTSADRVWLGTTSTDPTNANNWANAIGGAGGASVPDSTKNVIFGGNVNNNCTATGLIKWKSLGTQGTYTGTLNFGSNNLQVYGPISWDSGSVTSTGDILYQNNGDLSLGTSMTTATISGCDLVLKRGVLNIDKALARFKTITADSLTSTGSGGGTGSDASVTLNNNFYLDIKNNFHIYVPSTESNPINYGTGGTITGSAANGATNIIANASTGTQSFNIAALNITNVATFTIGKLGAATTANAYFTGNLSCPLRVISNSTASTYNIYDSNKTITVTTERVGSAGATNVTNMYYGSGQHTFGTFSPTATNYAKIWFQNAPINCSGAWTFSTNHTTDTAGSSVLTINGTAAQTITTQGLAMPKIVINNSGTGTVKNTGKLIAKNFRITDGVYKQNATTDTLKILDSLVVTGTDKDTFNSPIWCRVAYFGAGSQPVFLAGCDTIHITGCDAIVNNSGVTLPPVTYPVAGPISYDSANVHYMTGTAITALAVTNSGCGGTYTKDTLPPGLSINASTGAITGTPTNIDTLQSIITVTGAGGSAAKDTITFNIFRYTAGGQLSSRQKAFQSLRTNAYITP